VSCVLFVINKSESFGVNMGKKEVKLPLCLNSALSLNCCWTI